MSGNGWITLIIATAFIHLATKPLGIAPLDWVFKLLPMLLIIGLALRSGAGDRPLMYKRCIVAGLLFSIAGDAFLLLPDDPFFIWGLASFLTGHLCYVAAMVSRMKWTAAPALAAVPLAVYAYVLGGRFHESLFADDASSGLWIPVLIYIIVISVMCWSAAMTRNWHAATGAVLFVVSDSILAWAKFIGPLPAAGTMIMATYFAAQLFIAGSIADLFSRKRQSSIGSDLTA
ncbi:lysoplasmalogenase [Paenibacillus sp. J5C2022]|uniref:lysoplasmalogenase n=1 Tax=Paenibacillus sp. J5C2022 TaxID=2977129 RepID=UPI0021CFF096|nr:lysoplasmalogenase [Paenibacillus sp. J5C2022]